MSTYQDLNARAVVDQMPQRFVGYLQIDQCRWITLEDPRRRVNFHLSKTVFPGIDDLLPREPIPLWYLH